MENKPYNINSIRGGISPAYFIGSESSYLGSYGIEPEKKINGRISGAINPNPYEIGTSALKDNLWAIPNDQTNDIYYYNKDGDFGKIDVSGAVTEVSALSGASGNGLAYYNNYYYIATNSNIHRYGPMDDTPSLEEDWWTSIRLNDGIIQAQNDTISISYGNNTKVCQSLNKTINFKKIKLGLQNTGSDTTYSVKISIQGLDTSTVRPMGNYYGEFTYDRHEPDGEELASKTIDSPTNSMTITDIEFDEVVELSEEAVIVIETDSALTSNQAFNVMISDYGDAYPDYMMSYYDGDWNTTPALDWDTNTSSHSGEDTILHTYTIDTKDDEDISGVKVRFMVDSVTDTDWWGYKIYKNGSEIDSGSCTMVAYDSSNNEILSLQTTTSISYSDVSEDVSATDEVNIDVTITEDVSDGDVIGIHGQAVDASNDPLDARINYYHPEGPFDRYPYVYYADTSKAVDVGLYIENIDKPFRELSNETYPTIGSYEIPNHSMYVHSDNSLYFCDKNKIHRISTGDVLTIDSSDTFTVGDLIRGETSSAYGEIAVIEKLLETGTVQLNLLLVGIIGTFEDDETVKVIGGDAEGTVDGTLKEGYGNLRSDSGVLDLPNNPVSLTGIGTDIAVNAVKINSNASLYLWDTFDISFYRSIELPYETTSAMLTHNGTPYIWGGNSDGYSLAYYTGGNIEPIVYIDNGYLPLQGAVAGNHGRILWGCSQEYPESKGCVRAWGSKSKALLGLHNVISTDNQISSISDDYVFDADGVYKEGGSVDSVWRSDVISFGQPFDVSLVSIQLSRELAGADEVTVTFYYDNETNSESYEVVVDDYENRHLTFNPNVNGVQNMIIEVKFECDASVILPIKVYYNLYD